MFKKKRKEQVNLDDFHLYDQDPRKKILKLRKRSKRIRRNRRLAFLGIVFLIFIFLLTDLSKVKQIKIKGNNNIKTNYLLKESGINTNNFYFMVKESKIEKQLESIALIKQASVHTNLLGNVSIEITEDDLMAYAILKNKTYVIDTKGKVNLYNNQYNIKNIESFPRLTEFKNLEMIKTFAKQYVKVPNVIKNATSDIRALNKKLDPTRVEFVMDNGKKIFIRIEDMAERLQEKNFDYDAYLTEFSEYKTFSFEGRYMYVSKE